MYEKGYSVRVRIQCVRETTLCEQAVLTHCSLTQTLPYSHTIALLCLRNNFRRATVWESRLNYTTTTPCPRRSLELSKFFVEMSDTQCNSPPNRSYKLTTNHVNSVVNKLPKLFKFAFLIWCFISPLCAK